MITLTQYKEIKECLTALKENKTVNGPEFIELYNRVFNAQAKFSNCCPSENKNKLNLLSSAARNFEITYPKEAKEILNPPTAEKKKKRGRPRKTPAPTPAAEQKANPEKKDDAN